MAITDDGVVEKGFVGPSRVEHVLISAGTLPNGAILKTDVANLRRIIDARLWGLTSVVRHATPRMGQKSITVTSGSLSPRPRPGTARLTAMRSAVAALARELAPVRANAATAGILPQAGARGTCRTPVNRRLTSSAWTWPCPGSARELWVQYQETLA